MEVGRSVLFWFACFLFFSLMAPIFVVNAQILWQRKVIPSVSAPLNFVFSGMVGCWGRSQTWRRDTPRFISCTRLSWQLWFLNWPVTMCGLSFFYHHCSLKRILFVLFSSLEVRVFWLLVRIIFFSFFLAEKPNCGLYDCYCRCLIDL